MGTALSSFVHNQINMDNNTTKFLASLKAFELECEETEHTDVQALWSFMDEAKALLQVKREVRISVSGGVADVESAPDDVSVIIIDND